TLHPQADVLGRHPVRTEAELEVRGVRRGADRDAPQHRAAVDLLRLRDAVAARAVVRVPGRFDLGAVGELDRDGVQARLVAPAQLLDDLATDAGHQGLRPSARRHSLEVTAAPSTWYSPALACCAIETRVAVWRPPVVCTCRLPVMTPSSAACRSHCLSGAERYAGPA